MPDCFQPFHQRIETLLAEQRHAQAVALLAGALSDARQTDEALLWLGVVGLSSRRLALAQAALGALLFRDSGHQPPLLLARTLGGPEALAAAAEAYRCNPLARAALQGYLDALQTTDNPQALLKHRTLLTRHAPHLRDPASLAPLASHLRLAMGATCGAVWQAGQRLAGWCLVEDARSASAPQLTLQAGARRLVFAPNRRQPLPKGAAWWFELDLKGAEGQDLAFSLDGQALVGSPLRLQPTAPPALAGRSEDKAKPHAEPGVTVLIPVYRGKADTLACVESVLASQPHNHTPMRVMAINDASPEPELVAGLQRLAESGRIELVHQHQNLGFIGTVNHGLSLCAKGDIILLNADTLVHGNWVDRLRQSAYRHARTASVTPLSNNGELMSLLAPCEPAAALTPQQLAALDRAASQANAANGDADTVIDTGCGFCLYLRRDALALLGGLDPTLIRGYGEESDWCYRAHAQGWHHRGALNVVVAHQGGVSFGDEKRLRVKQNLQILQRRFPHAERGFNACLQRDPMGAGRNRLLRHWLRHQQLADLGLGECPAIPLLPSLAHGERALAGGGASAVLVRQDARHAVLMGAKPHPWRLAYTLPEERGTLSQDLRCLGLVQLKPSTHALHRWSEHYLPGWLPHGVDALHIDASHVDVANVASLAKPSRMARAEPWQHWRASQPEALLLAVAGRAESLAEPRFLQLANALARSASPLYLLPLRHPATHTEALWASGHVYPMPLAESRLRERVALCREHFPFHGVLLLDADPLTLEEARLLDRPGRLQPWLAEHISGLAEPLAERQWVALQQLTDLAAFQAQPAGAIA